MGLRGETDKMKQWLMLAPLLLLSGITQAGTLTVAPEQYGAIGDCEADDTAAFRAMNAAILDAQANDQLLQVTISFPPSRCYHYTWNRWLGASAMCVFWDTARRFRTSALMSGQLIMFLLLPIGD